MTIFASTTAAQIVRGRVLLPDSTTGLTGVAVSALDSTGATVAGAASDASGAYAVRLPRAGAYRLTTRRLGYAPTTLGPFTFEVTTDRRVDLVVRATAEVLSTVTSQAKTCDKDVDAVTLLRLIERTREVVARGYLAAGADDVRALVVQVDTESDMNGSNTIVYSDSARERVTTGPLTDAPLDAVLATGFVAQRLGGATPEETTPLFEVPTVETLMADEFLATHCLGLRQSPNESPERIGISFRPVDDVGARADVSGTLWVAREDGSPRQLDYVYTNVQNIRFNACESRMEAGRRTPSCAWVNVFNEGPMIFRQGTRARPPGGRVEFAWLPTGESLATRVTVDRGTVAEALRPEFRSTQLTRPKNCASDNGCRVASILKPRVGTRALTVARLTRNGAELYRDNGALAAMGKAASRRAGRRPAHVEGRVTDAEGRPLAGAVVESAEQGRAAIADTAGAFRLATLRAAPITLRVAHPGFDDATVPIALRPDSTHQVTVVLRRAGASTP